MELGMYAQMTIPAMPSVGEKQGMLARSRQGAQLILTKPKIKRKCQNRVLVILTQLDT